MVRVSRILKDYRETDALNSLIALCGFVDDTTFLTKAGAVRVVAWTRCLLGVAGGGDSGAPVRAGRDHGLGRPVEPCRGASPPEGGCISHPSCGHGSPDAAAKRRGFSGPPPDGELHAVQ